MELNDSNAVAKVLGTLLTNNELIDDERYPLDINYFYTRLDAICFSTIFNIFQTGIRKISNEHILHSLENYPEQLEYFISCNGEDYLNNCRASAEEVNYEYYYNRLKKFALLRTYKNSGFDISPIYDVNETNETKLEKMKERFDFAAPEEISIYFEKIINEIDTTFQTKTTLKSGHAGNNLLEYFNSLKESPKMGLGLNGDMLNTITRGARLRKLYIRSSGSGVGKALDNSTIIPTYNDGFKKVGEIKVGDVLIDREGKPTKVLAVYPQKCKKQVYKITFTDHRSARCCGEHLWSYKEKYHDKNFKTKTTKELMKDENKRNLFFPINKLIQYGKKDFDISPCWLGRILANRFADTSNELLKYYPDETIRNEYIPVEYQFGSPIQRIDLLKGLVDSCIKDGDTFVINFTSKRLVEDTILLCRGLEIYVDNNIQENYNDCGTTSYEIRVKIPEHYFIDIYTRNYNTKKDYVGIDSIELLDEFVDMTCFTVDNDEGLFLINDYIVTHNTRTLSANAAKLGIGTYYDIFEKQWIKTNNPQPSLYITSEQEMEEIQTIILAFVSGVDEEKILNRTESEEESIRISKAITLIDNGKLFIEPVGDYTIHQTISLIKRYKYKENILYVFHDYIHSSLNLLNEVSTGGRLSNLREDQALLMLTDSLKNICNRLNVFIFSSTQLNRTYKTEEKLDATVIRGALSISDKADYCSIMMNLEADELEFIRKLAEANNMKILPNVVSHVFKNRQNKYVDIKLYSYLDKATGQMLDLFALTYDNKMVEICPTRIIQKE